MRQKGITERTGEPKKEHLSATSIPLKKRDLQEKRTWQSAEESHLESQCQGRQPDGNRNKAGSKGVENSRLNEKRRHYIRSSGNRAYGLGSPGGLGVTAPGLLRASSCSCATKTYHNVDDAGHLDRPLTLALFVDPVSEKTGPPARDRFLHPNGQRTESLRTGLSRKPDCRYVL